VNIFKLKIKYMKNKYPLHLSFSVLILLCLILFTENKSQAQTTRYVPVGSNTPCYATIQAAITASVTGDTIEVDAGTYPQGSTQININKSITLRAKVGLATKPKITTKYVSYNDCAVRIGAANVVIDGFEIDGSSAFTIFPSSTSIYLVGDYNGSTNIGYDNWTVKNCYLHNAREGVRLSTNNYVTIQGNEIAQTVKHCIDCGYGFCNGIKVTHNWLHSEQSVFGAKPAGLYYMFYNLPGATVEISYNYCTGCRTFCDFAHNGNGTEPNNQVLIMHNTVDWNLQALPSPVTGSENAQQWSIAFWTGSTTQSWDATKFIIRDNIFSRQKYYEIANSDAAGKGIMIGSLNIQNNLFYKWYLNTNWQTPSYKTDNEWPGTWGAVGWTSTDGTPTFTNDIQGDPLYAATGTTAREYYAISTSSPAYHTASDGTEIGAWQAPSAKIWTGTINNDWNNPGNWSDGIVPTSGSDILFNASSTNSCVIDANRTVGSINNTTAYDLVLNGKQLTVTGSINQTSTGKIDATTSLSEIVLAGTSAQTITSGAFVSDLVDKLTINNSSGVTLGGAITVNTTLTMTSGLLTLGTNHLTLGSSATISGTPSATNMIIATSTGELRKLFSGTGSFTFPVGDNTGTAEYSPVTLNFNSGSFSSAYAGVNLVNSKHPNNTSLTDYLNRYWTLSQSGITNFSCAVTLQYLPADVSGTEANIYCGKYNGSSWVLLFAANTETHQLTGTVSSFSTFSGGESGVLPIMLSSFSSSIIGRNAKLSWVTASEHNNSGFDILRASVDKNNIVGDYSKVAFINGNGTTTEQKSYSYTDCNLNTGNYKYRLKQIDYNGNFEYHNLTGEVMIGTPSKFELSQNYPNPFNPVTNINFELPMDSKVVLKVYDISGREIKTLLNETKSAGYYSVTFEASNISSGVYFYRIQTEKYSEIKRMMVVK
jgi:hypothetical protein